MEYDELELDTLGDQKTALFVILSDTDSTFNFVAALMYIKAILLFAQNVRCVKNALKVGTAKRL